MIAAIPDYSIFGRATKLRLNPLNIPDLGWKWTDDLNSKGIGKVSNVDVIEILEAKYKTMAEVGSVFINTTIYLKPIREKTERTDFRGKVSPHEDDTALQALTTKSNFTNFKPTQHFRIHWICL